MFKTTVLTHQRLKQKQNQGGKEEGKKWGKG
jgi:hypothetical protein